MHAVVGRDRWAQFTERERSALVPTLAREAGRILELALTGRIPSDQREVVAEDWLLLTGMLAELPEGDGPLPPPRETAVRVAEDIRSGVYDEVPVLSAVAA